MEYVLKGLLVGLITLVVAVVLFGILFPMFVHGRAYSGPGEITEALVLGESGEPLRNTTVTAYLRGHYDEKHAMRTNDKGELIIDKKNLFVDELVGFHRDGNTYGVRSERGRVRPIFCKVDPQTGQWFRPDKWAGTTTVRWPDSPPGN